MVLWEKDRREASRHLSGTAHRLVLSGSVTAVTPEGVNRASGWQLQAGHLH